MRSSCRFGANNSVSEEAIASSGALLAAVMHIGLHREARRRQDAFGRFHVGRVEAEAFGQLEPALDAALGADIAVMVLDAVAPFQPRGAVAEARDHHRVLDRDRALVIVAVQRPGLHLALVELAAVQQLMERMQAVIARRADMAQRRLQLLGAVERDVLADRERGHSSQGRGIHSTISVPSAGICQPALFGDLALGRSRAAAPGSSY